MYVLIKAWFATSKQSRSWLLTLEDNPWNDLKPLSAALDCVKASADQQISLPVTIALVSTQLVSKLSSQPVLKQAVVFHSGCESG